MVAGVRELTYADYEKIPADGFPYEIIEGEEFMSPAPTPDQQSVLLEIARRLAGHAKARKLGRVFVAPIDVLLSEHDRGCQIRGLHGIDRGESLCALYPPA
jgi:hypothetical protein